MQQFTLIIFFLFILSFQNMFSQKITYNHLVDSTNTNTQEVIQLFEDYIKSEPQNGDSDEYWYSKSGNDSLNYDLLENEFKPSLYMGFPIHVLSIKSNETEYQIKAQFSYCQDDGVPYVLAIVNYYAILVNGEYKLFNALEKNRNDWNHHKTGVIDFYYPKSHNFNEALAEEANEFIKSITTIFEVPVTSFDYYLADQYDKIQHLKGFDYYIGMGGPNIPSGNSNYNKIYGAGMGEKYTHEIFHVQIDKHYPNKHYWITEGLATYISGISRGKPLEWHQNKIYKYLLNHPEVNLNNLVEFVNFDEYTDYHYAIGALIIEEVFKKGGWPLVKKFMDSGKEDEDFYKALENYLNLNQNDINEFIRKNLLKKFSA